MLNIPVKGDVLTHIQPGAGGYGLPARRDPARILADMQDEKITAELAERMNLIKELRADIEKNLP